MADSINSVPVVQSKTDLYAATGITTGTSIYIQNIGATTINFAEKATEPTTEIGGTISPSVQIQIDSGSTGVWVWSTVEDTESIVAVQEV